MKVIEKAKQKQRRKKLLTATVTHSDLRVTISSTPQVTDLLIETLDKQIVDSHAYGDSTLAAMVDAHPCYAVLGQSSIAVRAAQWPFCRSTLAARFGDKSDLRIKHSMPFVGGRRNEHAHFSAQQLAISMRDTPAGMIATGNLEDSHFDVLYTTDLYYWARTLVVAQDKQEAMGSREALEPNFPAPVFGPTDYDTSMKYRSCLVVTPQQDLAQFSSLNWDLVLVDLGGAPSPEASRLIVELRTQFLHALVDREEWKKMGAVERRRLVWLYGPSLPGREVDLPSPYSD